MATSGWDTGKVYYSQVLTGADSHLTDNPSALEQQFYNFIDTYTVDNVYPYRDQLLANMLIRHYQLDVDLGHLSEANEPLTFALKARPTELLPLFEAAVRRHARRLQSTGQPAAATVDPTGGALSTDPEWQVTLRSDANITSIRDIDASSIGKLLKVPGIIIAASSLSSKATHVHLMCKACKHIKFVSLPGGFSGLSLPRQCDAEPMDGQSKTCPLDPYLIMHDQCRFVDQQTLKLQEAPDMVPVGELPRHMLLHADRYLTGKIVPGTRVTVVGVYSIFKNKPMNAGAVAIRAPYLRVIGIHANTGAEGQSGIEQMSFTDTEVERYEAMARDEAFYDAFTHSIAPSIYGNDDIKRAIACLLFGGSRKILPDGMRLRGDINVLLLGDPSTAKSQLLKFVEKAAPVAVYTSGKGSSAAGLTASVIRDPASREFYLEGGAMVLADGGVVCIDEFDKMRDEDRVAIHEAMEQQTISIAKAGITTVLNSRTAVFAAANPVFGRYDDMRSPGDNIDFQSTILSRFDMIFIVRDHHHQDRDRVMAKHVMSVHMSGSALGDPRNAFGKANNANAATEEASGADLTVSDIRGYLNYARRKCAPRLSQEAAERLSSHYVQLRGQVREMERDMHERSSIPITVRQLEAIIRITESLAKMRLLTVAGAEHVDEAIRLFKASTMNAVQSGHAGPGGRAVMEEVKDIEKEIRRRLPIGSQCSVRALRDEFSRQGFSGPAVEKAIHVMISQEVLHYRNQRMTVFRASM
ncbi:MAG: MCM2/3/5 family-domain-containing protein [Piptocephalis tieghemiana]|nr:MAG: MCM2/3/5 family-domain-containing protein [Piptocephalis tieghemiana]